MSQLEEKLLEFAKTHRCQSKGALSAVLILTRKAKELGLPITPESIRTGSQGQIKWLSGQAIKTILADHKIDRILSDEGGRTSRGNLLRGPEYIILLNLLNDAGLADFVDIELWWIGQVRRFFASKPFTLRLDRSKSLRAVVRTLLEQAEQRQKEQSGTMIQGAVLQHLVGAKLKTMHPDEAIEYHGFSVADEGTRRGGDFPLGDTIIHVTTTPTERLLGKCRENLDSGKDPVVVTTREGCVSAESLAKIYGIEDRIEVIEIEQFLATNILERSRFRGSERRLKVEEILDAYNTMVDECEGDPSLRIELA